MKPTCKKKKHVRKIVTIDLVGLLSWYIETIAINKRATKYLCCKCPNLLLFDLGLNVFRLQLSLTLYHTILSFNDPGGEVS